MTRIICISDTHWRHEGMKLSDGDILIHAGDFCGYGNLNEAVRFCQWFANQPHAQKVICPGNHDLCTDASHCKGSIASAVKVRDIFRDAGIHLLIHEAVTINGLNFFGSPWTPEFYDWAWMRPRNVLANPRGLWRSIPDNTDVLVTHGPPFGVADLAPIGGHVGCKGLLERICQISPRLHVFGHIHEGYGRGSYGTRGNNQVCHWVNASSVDSEYRQVNKPIIVDL